jgi:hypothetical protein
VVVIVDDEAVVEESNCTDGTVDMIGETVEDGCRGDVMNDGTKGMAVEVDGIVAWEGGCV